MAVIETVLVKHPTIEGGVRINRSDFVPGVHELFGVQAVDESPAPSNELSVADLKAAIAEVSTLEELAIYIEAEQGRRDGGRKSALAALTERYEEIEAESAPKGEEGNQENEE